MQSDRYLPGQRLRARLLDAVYAGYYYSAWTERNGQLLLEGKAAMHFNSKTLVGYIIENNPAVRYVHIKYFFQSMIEILGGGAGLAELWNERNWEDGTWTIYGTEEEDDISEFVRSEIELSAGMQYYSNAQQYFTLRHVGDITLYSSFVNQFAIVTPRKQISTVAAVANAVKSAVYDAEKAARFWAIWMSGGARELMMLDAMNREEIQEYIAWMDENRKSSAVYAYKRSVAKRVLEAKL